MFEQSGGFHFPPCHMLSFCGLRILIDCPIELSALTVFSPLPTGSQIYPEEANGHFPDYDDSEVGGSQKRQKIEKPLDSNNLIFVEPWYKTVANLHLWNASFIDVVLISSPMGMVGLPFLTRMKGFKLRYM